MYIYLDSRLANVDLCSKLFSEGDIRVMFFLEDFLQLLQLLFSKGSTVSALFSPHCYRAFAVSVSLCLRRWR